MSTAERQAHWNAVYATKAEDEVSWFEPVPQLSLDLIGKTELPKTGAVIDIGGRLSHLADHLACDGYTDLTVIDVSSEAIRRLQERLGPGSHIRGIVADITEWKPDRAYDSGTTEPSCIFLSMILNARRIGPHYWRGCVLADRRSLPRLPQPDRNDAVDLMSAGMAAMNSPALWDQISNAWRALSSSTRRPLGAHNDFTWDGS